MDEYEREVCERPAELTEAPPRREERKSLLTSRVSWKSALAVLLALLVLRLWVVGSVIVDGASMTSTLASGEWVLVLKFLKPHRFSIIVFTDPQDTTAIKRVIGMPGDALERLPDPELPTVQPLRPITISGRLYHEPYAVYTGHGIIQTVEVPADSYFVMGDNRGDSTDSRAYGPVSRDRVKGVAVAVVLPLSRMRMISAEAEPVAEDPTQPAK